MILIGIDPGVTTGVAVMDGALLSVESMTLVSAMMWIVSMATSCQVKVYVEDARQRKWFGTKGRESLQGAGSIKRDCQIWEEWLTLHDIKFEMVPPKANKTKLNAEQFRKLTGWTGRTNEHGRDAAMLVLWRS